MRHKNKDNMMIANHIIHLEDCLFEEPCVFYSAIESLKDKSNYSLKVDGSPSIFIGSDPSDGEFFVSTKSIFNVNSKIYKTINRIEEDSSIPVELQQKLISLYGCFYKENIRGVIQGDFLYEKQSLKEVSFNQKSYIAFHPNTIVYSIPKDSDEANKIASARVGVAWHTEYRGDTIQQLYTCSTGEIQRISEKINDVYHMDVSHDTSYVIEDELNDICAVYRSAIIDRENLFVKICLDEKFKKLFLYTFFNIFIKNSIDINLIHFKSKLIDWVEEKHSYKLNSLKTVAAKNRVKAECKHICSVLADIPDEHFESAMSLYNQLSALKSKILKNSKMKSNIIPLLKKSENEYELTDHEGVVVKSKEFSTMVKIVDRTTFSKNNFSSDYVKGFQK